MTDRPLILLAGGGTGGHIYPNIAIAEALRSLSNDGVDLLFVVSERAVDQKIVALQQLPHLSLPMRGFSWRPQTWPGLIRAWRRSRAILDRQLRDRCPAVVVATGGFVSVPVLGWARKARPAAGLAAGVPSVVVNLDAVPGRANRRLGRRATRCFSAYACRELPAARLVGFPLRSGSVGPADQGQAKQALGFDPVSPLLLVVGGSSGAQTLNRTVEAVLAKREAAEALRGWNVLHLHGRDDGSGLARAYQEAGVRLRLEPYLDPLGPAWAAADLAISRAGAGSVAEAWANGCPTIFLPYPFHRDQHQKENARPMVETGGGRMVTDPADAEEGCRLLVPDLMRLLTEPEARRHARERLLATRPANGAETVAREVLRLCVQSPA